MIRAADVPAEAQAFYPDVVLVLADIVAPAAERAAEYLARPSLRVLDVGAGAAPWSLALARCDPACHVTAVDLPAVLTATQQAVAVAGCTAQFTFVGGDLFTADLSLHDYDLAIAGNICHLFDELTNRRLLSKLLHALRPLGRVAVIDVIPIVAAAFFVSAWRSAYDAHVNTRQLLPGGGAGSGKLDSFDGA